jgi:hypothetical protein
MIHLPLQSNLSIRTIASLDIAAASGIAVRDDLLYVVADDELVLPVYTFAGERVGSIPLVSGSLPDDPVARKAAKPDFEALLSLPNSDLLVLGSGSTSRRERGAWVRFSAGEATVEPIDLSELYRSLRSALPELNIEGGVIMDGSLWLCSRGDGARRDNALIRLDYARVAERMSRDRALPADAVQEVIRVALPEIDSTPLSLTDLAVVHDTLVFTAAAEATTSAYDDGECKGSIVGTLTRGGVAERMELCTLRLKLEGLCAQASEGAIKLWLVSDADDPAAHAPLMQIDWAP